jgi:GntR family transcriptional regulator/MocR family aminotransferase
MKLRYGKKRAHILKTIRKVFTPDECRMIENGSGLHLVLEFNTDLSDRELQHRLQERKIKIASITDYYMDDVIRDKHQFILNYSSLNMEGLEEALLEIKAALIHNEINDHQLTWLEKDSDNFIYVQLTDGAVFQVEE